MEHTGHDRLPGRMPSPRLHPLLPPGWWKVFSVLFSAVFRVHCTCSPIHSIFLPDNLRDDKNGGNLFQILRKRKNHALCWSLSIIKSDQAGCLDNLVSFWVRGVAKRTGYFLAHWWTFRGLPVCLDPWPLDRYLLDVFPQGICPQSTCLHGQDRRTKAPVLAPVTAQPLSIITSWRVDLSSCKVSKLGHVLTIDMDRGAWCYSTYSILNSLESRMKDTESTRIRKTWLRRFISL